MITRICNILAELCSRIISSCPDESLFVRFSCLSRKRREEMLRDISVNVSALFEDTPAERKTLRVRRLRDGDLCEGLYSALEGYITALAGRGEPYAMIVLAQTLDEAMKGLLLERIAAYQRDDFSVVLNTNRETVGIGLLPRCSCVWERSHRLSNSYNRLDNFLFNFLLIENTVLGELIDKHIFLSDRLFQGLSSRGCLRVAVSPLRREKHYTELSYIRDDIQYLGIEYDSRSFDEDNRAIWRRLLHAAENGCDIMVFPELLGNRATRDHIRGRLKALPPSEREKMPSLIILPSVWENNMNTVTVLDRFGDEVCCQSKQYPYRREQDGEAFLEDIKTNLVVNILHYEGIGRIAILICKDFLTTKYMEQLMRCFRLTLIIVPSFSTGSYDFRQSFDLCAHDDCNVIWINTCAAIKKGKEDNFRNIGYVRKRIGRNDDDSHKLCEMPVCGGAFEGRCGGDCIYFETIRGV